MYAEKRLDSPSWGIKEHDNRVDSNGIINKDNWLWSCSLRLEGLSVQTPVQLKGTWKERPGKQETSPSSIWKLVITGILSDRHVR